MRSLTLVRSRPTRFKRIFAGRIYLCPAKHQTVTYEVVYQEDVVGAGARMYLPQLEVQRTKKPPRPPRRAKSKPKVFRVSRRHKLEL